VVHSPAVADLLGLDADAPGFAAFFSGDVGDSPAWATPYATLFFCCVQKLQGPRHQLTWQDIVMEGELQLLHPWQKTSKFVCTVDEHRARRSLVVSSCQRPRPRGKARKGA